MSQGPKCMRNTYVQMALPTQMGRGMGGTSLLLRFSSSLFHLNSSLIRTKSLLILLIHQFQHVLMIVMCLAFWGDVKAATYRFVENMDCIDCLLYMLILLLVLLNV